MIDNVISKIGLLGDWTYLVLFFTAFLECSAFLGFFIPGETFAIASGFLASGGYLNVIDCIWICGAGAVLGDSTGYALGRKYGREYFEEHKRLFFLRLRHLRRADAFFERHGGKTIFFGRFIGFLRPIAPFSAGFSKMPYGEFLIYNVAGGIIWAAASTLAGYFFGRNWRYLEKWIGRTGMMIAAGIIVAAIGFHFWKERKRRRHD